MQSNGSKLGILQPLPDDILEKIFIYIGDAQTAFRFGVANTKLLVVGEKRIHELMGVPNWDGDRIMCAGDYQKEGDIPESVELSEEYDHFLEVECGDKGVCPNIFGWAELHFQRPASSWWASPRGCREEENLTYGIPSWRTEHDLAYDITHNACFVIDEPSVVWNLSKNVYFHGDDIPDDFIESNFPDSTDLDHWEVMGQALLYQICWSSDSTGCLDKESKMHRGRWAGDRFEVTDKEVMEQRLKEEEGKWKDVSKGVIGLSMDILKSMYRPDYSQYMMGTRRWYR